MNFSGAREWCDNSKRVATETNVGIERVVGILLHLLILISPPTWVIILCNRKNPWITDLYVVLVLIFSVVTFCFFPNVWCAGLHAAKAAFFGDT